MIEGTIGDVSFMDGRIFISPETLNVATVTCIGPGGLSVSWQDEPSPVDVAAFDQWSLKLYAEKYGEGNPILESTVSKSPEDMIRDYRRWVESIS